MTSGKGPDVSPAWNRKTGAQIAFVSGSTGLPQVYTMEADGTNLLRMTDQGYAVSPTGRPTDSSSPSPGFASTAPVSPAPLTSI